MRVRLRSILSHRRVHRNSVPGMRNPVPELRTRDLADEVAERSLADRQVAQKSAYADEVRRFLEAGFAVMSRNGDLEPRVSDIVRASGLSNQAFYRHFRGKDEFFVSLLEDGRRRLVETIERRMSRAADDGGRVRAWIEAVFAQAQDPDAAAATRPFALNGERLAARFPDAARRSRERLVVLLQPIVGDEDAAAIYQLAMGSMHDALVTRRTPSGDEVDHVVGFALRGAGLGT
jgi:AcrR family transcriptional regulator